MCRVIMTAHVLNGDDCLSKIGTKHAALVCNPVMYLSGFAEADEVSCAEIWQAEEYLVKVWVGARSTTACRTFSQLRLEEYTSAKSSKSLDSLPPTSSVVLGHLKRAHCILRSLIKILDREPYDLIDYTNHGWVWDCGVLLPDQCLNPLQTNKTLTCYCKGKCKNRRCVCRRENEVCTIFCHKKNLVCENH